MASEEAKDTAWRLVVVERKIPPGFLGRVGTSFWRPGQEDLLAPYAERFIDGLSEFGDAGMLWALSLSGGFYPRVGGRDGYVDRLDAAAGEPGVSPLVRQNVRERNDRRRRRDAARAAGGE